MNLFLAKNPDTQNWFMNSAGPGNALGPVETSKVLDAKKCVSFDELIKAIPPGYLDRYEIQRWTFKIKEVY